MNYKYKVGDKVRIKSKAECMRIHPGWFGSWRDADFLFGQQTEIAAFGGKWKGIHPRYHLHRDYAFYSEDFLVPLGDTPLEEVFYEIP